MKITKFDKWLMKVLDFIDDKDTPSYMKNPLKEWIALIIALIFFQYLFYRLESD